MDRSEETPVHLERAETAQTMDDCVMQCVNANCGRKTTRLESHRRVCSDGRCGACGSELTRG